MPKMKTNSGAKKRIGLTGSGKAKYQHAFHRHLLTGKTKKSKRQKRQLGILEHTHATQVRRLLPYGG